jgi:DNA-binding transcriptional LysR family regulator
VTLTLAFVPGVTLTKWTRLWEERRADEALGFLATTESTQANALLDGSAQVAFVRLPLTPEAERELSVIRLYSEVPVAVLPEDHPLADQDSVTLADLADITLHDNQGPLRDAVELIAAGVGALVVPHALARQYSRKDVVSRDVTDADETWIAVAWRTEGETADIEEFVGIVRAKRRSTPTCRSRKRSRRRSRRSSRGANTCTGRPRVPKGSAAARADSGSIRPSLEA